MTLHQDLFESLLTPIKLILVKSKVLGFESSDVSLLAQALVFDSQATKNKQFVKLTFSHSDGRTWEGRVTPGSLIFLESYDLTLNKQPVKDLIDAAISNLAVVKKSLEKAVKKEKDWWKDPSEANDKCVERSSTRAREPI